MNRVGSAQSFLAGVPSPDPGFDRTMVIRETGILRELRILARGCRAAVRSGCRLELLSQTPVELDATPDRPRHPDVDPTVPSSMERQPSNM